MSKKICLWYCVYVGLVGIVAFVLMLWLTPYGAGVTPDSTGYIEGAKSLLSGKGFSADGVPITHHPPLYSLILAAIGFIESDLVQAARLLNAFLFGISVGLVAFAVYSAMGVDFFAITCAMLVFLSSAQFMKAYSRAMSEPLFIVLSLVCIILLAKDFVKPTLPLLILSSIFLGGAIVTRYIGGALLPTALVIILFSRDFRKLDHNKIRDILIWGGLSCAPIGLLFIRNKIATGLTANRKLNFHPGSMVDAWGFMKTMHDFVFPLTSNWRWLKAINLGLLSALFIMGVVILFIKWIKGQIDRRVLGMPIVSFLFSLSYILFLLVSLFFFDANTTMDSRILSPVFIFLLVGIFPSAWILSKTLKRPSLWWGFLLLVSLSITIKTPHAIKYAKEIRKNGQGYTTRQWQESETIRFIRLLTGDINIYSNGSDVIGFLSEKEASYIPNKILAVSDEVNSLYDEQLEAMCKDMKHNGAMLVYFNTITWRWYQPDEETLIATCQLEILRHFADSTVYVKK